MTISASVGVARGPLAGPGDGAALLRRADHALYRAKAGGKARAAVAEATADGT